MNAVILRSDKILKDAEKKNNGTILVDGSGGELKSSGVEKIVKQNDKSVDGVINGSQLH